MPPISTGAVDWLLGSGNPSIRLLTFTELLGYKSDSVEVGEARRAIMTAGIVPELLALQNADGSWNDPVKFYTDKYCGTVWQLMILAEHVADNRHPGVINACEFILQHSQELRAGGFSAYHSEKNGGGLPAYVIPCLTGNMVWSLIRLGMGNDERVKNGIHWINTFQRFDDGDTKPPKGAPYDRYDMCWGWHSCHLGVVKAMKALAEIPVADRSAETRKTIERGVEYLLIHHIYKRSHNLDSVSKPGWLKLGFPLMYQTDILEILLILTKLGCRDPRMQDAIDIVLSKQDANGIWKLENKPAGKFQVKIERKGKPSPWITLRCLQVLKSWDEGQA
jgi:hypothetical protein